MMLLPGPLMVVLPCLLVNELLDFSRNEALNLLQCLVVSFNGKLVTTGVVALLATSFTIAANWRPQVALEQSKQVANELLSNCSGNHSRDTYSYASLLALPAAVPGLLVVSPQSIWHRDEERRCWKSLCDEEGLVNEATQRWIIISINVAKSTHGEELQQAGRG
jgi:hypothetical protein